MTVKYYLQIPGIDGESTDGAHAGWIDIESYREGEKRLETGGANRRRRGSKSGQGTPEGYHFTKKMDKATQKLMQAAISGKLFPKVTLDAVRQLTGRGRGRQHKVTRCVFEDALITKYSLGPPGDDFTPERFTLVVEKDRKSVV